MQTTPSPLAELLTLQSVSEGTSDYSKNALPGQTLAPQTAAARGD